MNSSTPALNLFTSIRVHSGSDSITVILFSLFDRYLLSIYFFHRKNLEINIFKNNLLHVFAFFSPIAAASTVPESSGDTTNICCQLIGQFQFTQLCIFLPRNAIFYLTRGVCQHMIGHNLKRGNPNVQFEILNLYYSDNL